MEWTVRKWLGGCHAGAEAAGTRHWEVEWDRSVASRTHRRQGETTENACVQLLTIVIGLVKRNLAQRQAAAIQ
jgi:hypothetical protein